MEEEDREHWIIKSVWGDVQRSRGTEGRRPWTRSTGSSGRREAGHEKAGVAKCGDGDMWNRWLGIYDDAVKKETEGMGDLVPGPPSRIPYLMRQRWG